MIQCKPYAGLACFYDRIMNHVRYEQWVPYIASIFKRHGVRVESILEIACGTGAHTKLLAGKGYRLTGIDRSLPMLQIAQRKFDPGTRRPHFISADMTAIPLDTRFDAVICLYDSINYLCEKPLFKAALDEAARVTRPGGLYVFDVCTERNSKLYFSHHESTETFDGAVCHRTSRYHKSKRLQENSFVIEVDGDTIVEHHVQKIYSLREIREMIAETDFELLDVFNDMSFLPGTELSERVHFVLAKRGGGSRA